MDTSELRTPSASRQTIIGGAAWMVFMRWTNRGIGLISTIILARLLTPEDFGIVAMAALVIGLLDIFTEFGVAQMLIRTQDADRRHYDTAWTINIIQSVLQAALIVALSPVAVLYFGDDRVAPVMYVVAASHVITGFANIGTVDFRKQLDFGKDFRFEIYVRVFSFVLTITAAVILQSYWALVLGPTLSKFFKIYLSYRMHPFRPRLSLGRWREFLSYTVWMTPANVAYFLNGKADVFVIGAIGSTSLFGLYNVAASLSQIVTAEFVKPLGRALLPNYSALSKDKGMLHAVFRKVFQTVSIIALSTGVGLALVADDFVLVVLGDQWTEAAIFVQWLGLFAALSSLLDNLTYHILIVLRLERVLMVLNLLRLAVFAGATAAAGMIWGAEEVAIAATAATAAMFPVALMCLKKYVGISPLEIVGAMHRPVIGAIAMAVAVKLVDGGSISIPAISLSVDIVVGAVVFVATVLALWRVEKRPAGFEELCVNAVRGQLLRMRQRFA